MAEHWNPRDDEHVSHFRRHVLAPLIAATRPSELRTADAVNDAARAWILSLADVSEDVLGAGVARLLREGQTWMPRPGDLRKACASVITDRRRALAPRAAEIRAACDVCNGSGFETVLVGGTESVRRCLCHERALAVFAGVPEQLALPPAPDEDAA